MYIKKKGFHMNRRRRRMNPIRVFVLLVLIGGVVYLNQLIGTTIQPPFVPTPTATKAPESYLTDAQALENEGKLIQAVNAYKEAIRVDPDNAGSYISLARLQIYLKSYDDALENLGNAMLLNDANAMAFSLRGWALGLTGQFLDAKSALDQAIAIDPNNGVHYAHLAEVYGLQYIQDGDFTVLEEARSISQKAQELSPNALETYRARGYILYLYGQYQEAVLQYEKAINLNPNIADLHLALGRVYRTNELAEYNLATDEFRLADNLNPTDPMPDFLLSRVYFTQGEFTTAIQYAETAVRDEPSNPDWHGNLGTLLYRNGEYGKAITELGLVIKGGQTEDGVVVDPLPLSYDTAAYFYTYGLALAKAGECGEALQLSQALIQNVANDEFAMFNAEEIVNICQQVADGELIITPEETDGDSANADSTTP